MYPAKPEKQFPSSVMDIRSNGWQSKKLNLALIYPSVEADPLFLQFMEGKLCYPTNIAKSGNFRPKNAVSDRL
jgi:hypothetical protein